MTGFRWKITDFALRRGWERTGKGAARRSILAFDLDRSRAHFGLDAAAERERNAAEQRQENQSGFFHGDLSYVA